ncbi:MAG: DNA repair protein RecO [Candidatus Woesebacteria bacterium]|nr:MAG: DNA repair protein RecO [Candidatus Woesebacteria bacterium]
MRFKTFKSEGIIISRKNFSEADRLITLFTKDFGKITLLAKGVRKPKSRKRGSLEIFTLVSFQASETNSINLITEVTAINNFPKIRNNLKRTSVAFFICELVSRLTQYEEPHLDLFFLVVNTLKNLQTSQKLRVLRENFIKDSVVLLGFWPSYKKIDFPDKLVEEIAEKRLSSIKIGKLLSS